MPPALRTARLALRPLALDDAPAIQALFPRPEIVRFLSSRVPWPYPPGGATAFLTEHVLPAVAAGREWHWSIRERDAPDRLIGAVSLMASDPDDNRGIWLDPAFGGRGFATEAVEAATAWWFDALDRPELRAPRAERNVRSWRLAERTGMRLIRREQRDHVCGREAAGIFAITRTEWTARLDRIAGRAIRPGRPDDAGAVRRITEAAYARYVPVIGGWPAPATVDHATMIARGDVLVAVVDGTVVGLLALERAPDHLAVFSVAVAPGREGQGHGRALLRHATDLARAERRGEIRLYTNALMARNIALYGSVGFGETGQRPHPARAGFTVVDMARPVRWFGPAPSGSDASPEEA